ncbi:DNA-binding transcriptional LysR family regulator [Kitasatospora sp. MAP12-15]|uniref:LysR family transcriptional regulator n=1 Tax=unclassified Kitasatospora TaxID=2633591 RepID=UPI0024730F31|nr:LysR family transcriptional regulator [Kitasatospora sp. MAP12-44]MDH6108806.1 DNA-binding transcriptional LysR family regulator [Kitasatospora sp. MAP12-44]
MVLSPRMPELRALEVLLAVARSGSLNAAARELGVTQQAVSARITSVEAQTGVPLVLRTPQGSTLTPAGVVAAEWASRLLDVAAEVELGLAALRQDRRTRLRVSASLTIAEHLLPGWLVSLQAAAQRSGQPAAEVVLIAANSDTVIDQVRHGQADLGFVEGPSTPRDVRSRVVAHDVLTLVVRHDHPWARRRRPVTAEELNRTPLVSREHGSGTRDVLAAALNAALGPEAVQGPPVMALSTTAAVRAAVLAGAGPAVLSELAVADDLTSRRLHQVPVAGLDLTRVLRAIWLGPSTPPAGAVRDLVAHAVRHRAPGPPPK